MNTQLIPRELNCIIDMGSMGSNTVSNYSPLDMTTIWESLSENTRTAYERARSIYMGAGFRFQCTRTEILDFIDFLAGENADNLGVSSIELHLNGVNFYNKLVGGDNLLTDSVVVAKLAGLRRLQHREKKQAHAISTAELDRVIAKIDIGSRKGIRDNAMILVGFYGCLRRSEVVGIDLGDLTITAEGLTINIPVAKTGINQKVRIPLSNPAVAATQNLLLLLQDDGVTSGKLFRSITKWQAWGESMSAVAYNKLLKELAEAAGLDSDLISGHSLRSGCATSLFKSGVDAIKIQKHGRWSNPVTVANYYRPEGFEQNALNGLS